MISRTCCFFFLLLVSSFASASGLGTFNPGPDVFSEYKGKWLVVMLWASDCHICNQEAHQYVDFYDFHHEEDATVVGISLDGDDQAAALQFIERHEVTFPNFITSFAAGGRWFEDISGQRFAGTPGFLVFDKVGNLRAQQIGAVPVALIEQFIEQNSSLE